MNNTIRAVAVAAFTALSFSISGAGAQEYPTKSINLVVPFAPGGALDMLGRIVGSSLEETLGKDVLVDNRPGVGGYVGAEYVSRQAPDGHNLLIAANGNIHARLFQNDLANLPEKLTPVAGVAYAPFVFAVPASFPAQTLSEFVDEVKKNPGKYRMAVLPRTTAELDTRNFLSIAGLDMTVVPYNSASEIAIGLVRSDVHAYFSTIASFKSQIEAGTIRVLAVTTPEQSDLTPGIPSMKEQGIEFASFPRYIIFAPSAIDEGVADRVHAAVAEGLKQPETQARLQELGFGVLDQSREELAADVAFEVDHYGTIAKTLAVQKK